MIIAIDFDGVVVDMRGRAYSDVSTTPRLMPGAKAGLIGLKRAGHTLLLYSARANRSLRQDPQFDPLIREGVCRVRKDLWERALDLNERRYQQMVDFVGAELPGVFDAIDDGAQGKPVADMFLDDRCVRVGNGPLALSWGQIAAMYGEPVYGVKEDAKEDGGVSDQ